MQSLGKFKPNVFLILGGVVVGLLLLPLACGASAPGTPATRPADTPRPIAAATIGARAPTAIPAVAASPTAGPVSVSQGKLTVMIADWGNERYTQNYTLHNALNGYGRILQAMLIATNEKTELLPGIATKWEISADGKTWTFTIREGAKFHDGTEVTAEDVWWTWMHLWGTDASGSALKRSPSAGVQARARWVEKFEVVAHNQVSFTRKAPDPGFPFVDNSEAGQNWWVGVVPRRPKVHDDAQEAAYDKNPIGAGLGRLVKHIPSDLMAFERFDDYYYQPKNGLPEDRRLKFKFLDLRQVPEEATRVAAVRAGEADIVPVSLSSRNQVEAGGGRLIFGREGIYLRVQLLGCYKPQYPCHDKRVRQALDLAIDKELVRDKLFGGTKVFEVKGWAFVTPSTIGYSPDLDPWPQDVPRARKLLGDAGYPGGKGFGKLIVNTYVSSAAPLLPESAQLAADFWRRELGLDVEVKVVDRVSLQKALLTDELHGQVVWIDNTARADPANLHVIYYGTPDAGSRLHEDPALFEADNQTVEIYDPLKEAKPITTCTSGYGRKLTSWESGTSTFRGP